MHAYKPASLCDIVATVPRFQGGTGVKLKGVRTRRSRKAVQKAQELVARQFADGWLDAPSLPQQLLLHPDKCRYTDPQAKQFDLSDAKEMEEYSQLFAKTFPPDAPLIKFIHREKEWCPDVRSWKILLEFCRVQYKPLIPLEDLQKNA